MLPYLGLTDDSTARTLWSHPLVFPFMLDFTFTRTVSATVGLWH